MNQHNRAARLCRLFFSTLYISSFTFGGGFVIVTLMKKKFVDELHWITEEEMLDMTALAESAPGAIAVNAAILVGWQVEELLGDGPQTSMEGVDNINDALRLDFKNDRNVTVIYKGEEIGTFPWSVALGYCAIESDNPSLSVAINDDGTLKVDYSNDEDYYTFHCVKSDGE